LATSRTEALLLPAWRLPNFGKAIMIGVNDMRTTNPKLVSLLLNDNDGYRYSQKSNKKVWWKCPSCGQDLYRRIADISTQGLSCPRCSDYISYANKFAYSMLDQLGINFEPEFSPPWIKPKRYDFYFVVNNKQYILEMDGIQHFKQSFPLPLDDVLEADQYKERMAIAHNIKLIRIDCRNRDQIIKNIYDSELNNILNLSQVDWDKCHIYTYTSKKIDFFTLYHQGKKIPDIAKYIQIDKATLYRWLRDDFIQLAN
jgi:transposase-like protein